VLDALFCHAEFVSASKELISSRDFAVALALLIAMADRPEINSG
jgi:hypothetical protein